jgi:hypothetical protein
MTSQQRAAQLLVKGATPVPVVHGPPPPVAPHPSSKCVLYRLDPFLTPHPPDAHISPPHHSIHPSPLCVFAALREIFRRLLLRFLRLFLALHLRKSASICG